MVELFGKQIKYVTLVAGIFIIVLIVYLIKIYRRTRSRSSTLESNITALIPVYPNIRNLDIREISNCDVEQSNTEDKAIIFICTSDREGEPYSNNKIRHIILHEIAHKLCIHVDEHHQSDEFKMQFDMLLSKASLMRIIDMNRINRGEYYADGRTKKHFKPDENFTDEENPEDPNDPNHDPSEVAINVDNLNNIANKSNHEVEKEKVKKSITGKKDDTVKIIFADEEDDDKSSDMNIKIDDLED